jgi:hypothetical protein
MLEDEFQNIETNWCQLFRQKIPQSQQSATSVWRH